MWRARTFSFPQFAFAWYDCCPFSLTSPFDCFMYCSEFEATRYVNGILSPNAPNYIRIGRLFTRETLWTTRRVELMKFNPKLSENFKIRNWNRASYSSMTVAISHTVANCWIQFDSWNFSLLERWRFLCRRRRFLCRRRRSLCRYSKTKMYVVTEFTKGITRLRLFFRIFANVFVRNGWEMFNFRNVRPITRWTTNFCAFLHFYHVHCFLLMLSSSL